MTTVHDAHVHVWSADQIRYPLAPGLDNGDLWLPSFTPDDHESIAGGRLPINLVQMTWYGLDHRYILDLIASDPATYIGTGIVPGVADVSLADPGKTMIALAAGGIRAFRVRGGKTGPQELAVLYERGAGEAQRYMYANITLAVLAA